MNEFKTYHPIVNFTYFVFVIGFSMFLMHPVCLVVSFVCGFIYSVMLKGIKGIKQNLLYMLPLMLIMAVMNPIFNHQGITVLGYFPDGNPFTLESVLYGVFSAIMLASVICWFSCYNKVMTSDKFIYLFGRIIPALSLVISMTMRFVPRFAIQLKNVSNAQRCMGRDISKGNVIKRAKCGLAILSATVGRAMEDAVETADSMKSRGYGLPGRTAFSVYTFDKRDTAVLVCILLLGVYTLAGSLWGGTYFVYFPVMTDITPSPLGISVFCGYFMLCICPVIIELWEVRRWKALRSKI